MKLLLSLWLLNVASANLCECGGDPAEKGFQADAICASMECNVYRRDLENPNAAVEPSHLAARRDQGCVETVPKDEFYVWRVPEFFDPPCEKVCCSDVDREPVESSEEEESEPPDSATRGACVLEDNICAFKSNGEILYSVCVEKNGKTAEDCVTAGKLNELEVGDTFGKNDSKKLVGCGCCNPKVKKKCGRKPLCSPEDAGVCGEKKNGRVKVNMCINGKDACKNPVTKKKGKEITCGVCER